MFRFSATSDVPRNHRFSEGILEPGHFGVAYAFMPMHEKCPDSSVAEITGVFKGFSVERVEDLINAQLLFTKSHLF